jgi:hypothetical protein
MKRPDPSRLRDIAPAALRVDVLGRTPRRSLVTGALVVASMVLWSCSGGGSASGVGGGGEFAVLRTEPPNNGALFLNDPIRIDFTTPVDLDSANLNTIAFQVFDKSGKPLTEQPTGTFQIARSPGDSSIGRRLEFVPRFPTNNTFTDGGFRPGRTYLVQLVGGDRRQGAVLLDTSGKSLASPVSFQFKTADGATPSELFRDTRAGGPRRVGFSVTGGTTDALLNKGGQTPVEVVLQFDQPLNPQDTNVPVNVELDPTRRVPGQQGKIFLEYKDSQSPQPQWIPAKVVLTVNSITGSEVRLLPVGVLPNNATITVVVDKSLQDMSGESNDGDASYRREFATFTTQQAFDAQFDGVVESFDSTDRLDFEAAFLDPVAEIDDGFIKANFEFEGASTILDFQPSSSEVILNTDFTQVTPKNGPPINVSGGVFQFRNVTIPPGVTVRATGSKPMIWLVTGNFTVDGILRVDGGDGARVDTLQSANFPTPGGVGVAGGGNGGRGSPNTQGQSPTGEAGFGPGGIPAGGGAPGQLALRSGCGRGSGGGGGTFSTVGDPYFKQKNTTGTGFIQQKGNGGFGCAGMSGAASRVLPGGAPGPRVFTDIRTDNNFWGLGVNVNQQVRITGELLEPQGGAGGGGGGNLADQLGNQNFITNSKGGGGGAGGGVLIVKALGSITVGSTGLISANGGHGGGGEQAGGNNEGGGGGGGSGGMVVLMAGQKISLEAHGETYASAPRSTPAMAPPGAFSYVVSADGGIGTQGEFTFAFESKYPPPADNRKWDENPAGGFGGLGLVQLMAPAGDDSMDQTGTVLDDNIEITRAGTILTGIEKQRFLAWRGFPNQQGIWVDDNGNPTYNNDPTNPLVSSYPSWATSADDEGDIRPAPILLPAPFGHKSRIRTHWIDLGVGSVRLPTSQFGTNGPRRIREDLTATPPLTAGPRYEFSGTNADATTDWVGYIDYQQTTSGIALDFPKVGPPHAVSSIGTNSSFQGRPAYEVTLAQAPLGSTVDRFAQYQAQLRDANGSLLGQYRIISHTSQVVFLSPDQGPLPTQLNDVSLQIVAQFFDVRTNGVPGLGPTYTNTAGGQSPVANVRFGFAFHKDPSQALSQGMDPLRFPQQVGTFLYDEATPLDLSDPATQDLIQTMHGGMPFVMWDVQFNTRFSETEPGNTRLLTPLSPSSPRPELHFLIVPYRF